MSNHQLLYPHSLNHPHPPNSFSHSPLWKIFFSLPGLTFDVIIETDALLVHVLEELQSLASGGGGGGAGTSCHTASSHSSFHWIWAAAVSTVLAPHNLSFRQTMPDQAFGTFDGCITPFELLSKSALSASECRKTLFSWRQPESLGRGGPFLTGDSSSVNLLHVLLPSRHGCVAKCDSPASRIVDTLLTKSDFSQKLLGRFASNFLWCYFRSQRTFLGWFGGRNARFHFLTCFSPGR